MSDTMYKTTSQGLISVEITLEGEGSKIPNSEVLDLIKILRETADALETTFRHCTKDDPTIAMGVSFKIH